MNAAQIYKQMVVKAETLSVDELKNQAIKLMEDTSETAGTLFNVILAALENKMPEEEYVEFCNAM